MVNLYRVENIKDKIVAFVFAENSFYAYRIASRHNAFPADGTTVQRVASNSPGFVCNFRRMGAAGNVEA